MARLVDVFSEQERTNWLKAWIAIDIAKSGLEQFVDTEAKNAHSHFYQNVWSSLQAPAVCIGCNTANLLKCPTPGMCNKRRPNGLCTSMHDTQSKQHRPCPLHICDQIRKQIEQAHRYGRPSWKCSSAQRWAKYPWEIAKCFFPPDGYDGKSSVNDTDFNGVISFLSNCTHFDSKFSFPIASSSNPPCLLTKARDICKAVRHSSQCKVTDVDLRGYFTTLIDLLSDKKCLVNDSHAQDAVRKLTELQGDTLKITLMEMLHLMGDAATQKFGQFTEQASNEMKACIEKCTKEIETQTNLYKYEIESKRQQITNDESSYIDDCKVLKQRMKQYYNTSLRHTPISALSPLQDKPLLDIYMSPKIQKLKHVSDSSPTEGEQIYSYRDILRRNKHNQPIFLKGEPGTGKSTFAAKLVLDWCGDTPKSETTSGHNTYFEDIHTLQEYEFVFLVILRDSVNEREVMTMIKEQIIDNIYAEKDREKAYTLLQVLMEKEVCLLIQDGLDEWYNFEGKQSQPFLQPCYDRCTVLITTRPWKLAESIRDSYIGSLLEITGIRNPYMLTKNILVCCQREQQVDSNLEFKEYIHKNELEDFVSVPMILTLIVCLWMDRICLKGSLCEIYSTLLDSLLEKASDTNEYFYDSQLACFKATRFIRPNIEFVKAISTAAFYLMFSFEREKSLVFSEIDFYQYLSHHIDKGKIKSFALKAGILSQRRSSSFNNRSPTLSFVHKSIQEFLAAYYIADNIIVIDDKLCEFVTKFEDAHLQICDVFRFLCGLNINAANKLSCVMYDHVARLRTSQPHFCESRTFQKIIIYGYKEAKANKHDESQIRLRLSHFYFDNSVKCKIDFEILTCITKANIPNMRCWYIWGDGLPVLMFAKGKHSHVHAIKDLYQANEGDYKLFDLSSCTNLEEIHLVGKVTWLPNALCNLHNLKHIAIKVNVGKDLYLLDLSSSHGLESLELDDSNALLQNPLPRHLKRLKLNGLFKELDLSLCHCLETVELGSDVQLVTNGLSQTCKIKHLTVLGSCDGLNLPPGHNIETINLSTHVQLLPTTLRGNITHIKLYCFCSGLDMSLCNNLQEIQLGPEITLVPASIRHLHNLKKLTLHGACNGLDLLSCHSLETVTLGNKIVLLPVALPEQFNRIDNCSSEEQLVTNALSQKCKIKHLTVLGSCDGLNLPPGHNIETIKLSNHVRLLPTTLRGNITHIKLYCMCSGLDLSLCNKLQEIVLGPKITLVPASLRHLHNLKHLTLQGKCIGLDLLSCHSLESIQLGNEIVLLPGALPERLNSINLKCKCTGLDLSLCIHLETIVVGPEVTLLPNAVCENVRSIDSQYGCSELNLLKHVALYCKVPELNLFLNPHLVSLALSLESAKDTASVLPNTVCVFPNLRCISFACKNDIIGSLSCTQQEANGFDADFLLVINTMRNFNVREIDVHFAYPDIGNDMFIINLHMPWNNTTRMVIHARNQEEIINCKFKLTDNKLSTLMLRRLINTRFACNQVVELHTNDCPVSKLEQALKFIQERYNSIGTIVALTYRSQTELSSLIKAMQGTAIQFLFIQLNCSSPTRPRQTELTYEDKLSSDIIELRHLKVLRIRCYEVEEYINIRLPQSLTHLYIACDVISPSQLRTLVCNLSTVDHPIQCLLKFGCNVVEDYTAIKQEIELSEYVAIKTWERDIRNDIETLARLYDCSFYDVDNIFNGPVEKDFGRPFSQSLNVSAMRNVRIKLYFKGQQLSTSSCAV